MEEISTREGRTILFVSHNLGGISQLCNRVIYLKSGHVELDTKNVEDGIKFYLEQSVGPGGPQNSD